MSGRPKRVRNTVTRYGFEDKISDEEDYEAEEIEVAPRQKVQRIKKEEEVIDLTLPGPEAPTPTQLLSVQAVASPDLYGFESPEPPPKQPGPRKKVTLTKAKADFKLNDDDLRSLSYESEPNPHGNFAPMRLYKAIDCWNVAMLKYGSPEGLQAAISKSRQRGSKAKATRDLHAKEKAEAESRRTHISNLLQNAGVPLTYLNTDADIMFYISSGVGDVPAILDKVKQQEQEQESRRQERITVLREYLHHHGLLTASFESLPVFQTYIKTGQNLEQALQTHANNLAKEREKIQRIAALNQRLVAHGLPAASPNGPSHVILQDYMKGKETLDAAMSRYMSAVIQERQNQERRSRIVMALHAENLYNLGNLFIDSMFKNYILNGDEGEFNRNMEAMRNMLNFRRGKPNKKKAGAGNGQQTNNNHNTNNNGHQTHGTSTLPPGQPLPPPPPRPPGLPDNICSADGCGKVCSLKCTYRMCGVHKDRCKDPRCKKHSTTSGFGYMPFL